MCEAAGWARVIRGPGRAKHRARGRAGTQGWLLVGDRRSPPSVLGLGERSFLSRKLIQLVLPDPVAFPGWQPSNGSRAAPWSRNMPPPAIPNSSMLSFSLLWLWGLGNHTSDVKLLSPRGYVGTQTRGPCQPLRWGAPQPSLQWGFLLTGPGSRQALGGCPLPP